MTNKSSSALSGARRFLFGSKISPAPPFLMEQRLEVQTKIFEPAWKDVENRSRFLPTRPMTSLYGRVAEVLQDNLSTSALCASTASCNTSAMHFSTSDLGRFGDGSLGSSLPVSSSTFSSSNCLALFFSSIPLKNLSLNRVSSKLRGQVVHCFLHRHTSY